jgi:hypothetical protein
MSEIKGAKMIMMWIIKGILVGTLTVMLSIVIMGCGHGLAKSKDKSEQRIAIGAGVVFSYLLGAIWYFILQ